jgi:hypothetical protein
VLWHIFSVHRMYPHQSTGQKKKRIYVRVYAVVRYTMGWMSGEGSEKNCDRSPDGPQLYTGHHNTHRLRSVNVHTRDHRLAIPISRPAPPFGCQ